MPDHQQTRQRTQWRIERAWTEGSTLILRCQGDLRQLGTAFENDEILLKDMRFDQTDSHQRTQIEAIRAAVAPTQRAVPNQEWIGTEFTWTPHDQPRPGIARARDTGQYRLWIPQVALDLYERVRRGADLGLCEHNVSFLGGGTVLAARWKHRTSTDIDIFWHKNRWSPNETLRRLEEWLGRFEEQPETQQMSPDISKIEWREGDTDFIATPILTNRPHRDAVQSTTLTACSTAEILAGKIIGRALIPFRDIFDAATAAIKQPQELDEAFRIAKQYPISGQTAIDRIPEYCRDAMESGDWKRQRNEFIKEPNCKEAWDYGPNIVRQEAQRWSSKPRQQGQQRHREGGSEP